MRRFTHFGLAACLAFTFACGDGPTEAASTSATESESGSGSTTNAESESGSASMSGDGDGDAGDGDGDTGDGDGDTGDGDGDTGDGDGDSGDGDGDTGDGDGDTGDGDGDTTGDGDGDGDTGDGDGDGGQDYYGDCPMNNECLQDEYCFVDNGDDYQVCSQNCNNGGDCPGVQGHSTQCIGLNGNLIQKRCFISCEDNEQCPIGMDCQGENFDIDFICVYPQP